MAEELIDSYTAIDWLISEVSQVPAASHTKHWHWSPCVVLVVVVIDVVAVVSSTSLPDMPHSPTAFISCLAAPIFFCNIPPTPPPSTPPPPISPPSFFLHPIKTIPPNRKSWSRLRQILFSPRLRLSLPRPTRTTQLA